MKHVLIPLARSILILLGLIAEVSATDTAMHKKCLNLVQRHWKFRMKKWMITWKLSNNLNNLV